MFAVIEKAKVLHLPVDILCELFNVCVVPVLLYGSEIWGFENLRDVEIFHRGFMRLILKVFKFTPNAMLYGELGATDMSTIIHKRMINFWLKLKFSPLNKFSSIMCRLMSKLHIDYPDSYNFKWCCSIQSSLYAKGFSEVWNVSCIDIDYFKEIFAQRCYDIFLQNWHTSINENSQCTNYSIFKQSLQIEDYLVQLDDDAKYNIAKFRTRSHHLPVTNNRFQSNNAEDTTCPLCQNGEIGDEFHYLYKCTYFNESRNKFLPDRIYGISDIIYMRNLFEGMKRDLEKLAQFIKLIMKKFVFNRRTADTDSVSISKKNNVITTRSGRQVNPPKKLCLWLFMSLLFINSLLFNYLLFIYNAFIIYLFIHSLFICVVLLIQ